MSASVYCPPASKKILFAPEPVAPSSPPNVASTPHKAALGAAAGHLHGKTLRGEVTVPPRTNAELRLPSQRNKKLSPGRHNFTARIKV
jgi:hypothetical protein